MGFTDVRPVHKAPVRSAALAPGTAPATLPVLLRARVFLPVCVVLGALSLLLARSPAYDVWSWLIWGREAAHLDLDTSFGPQFKPLPVAVAALGAPLGDGAVQVWMLVARVAGLLAVVGAARVAWRSYGRLAAALAAAAVLTSSEYTFYLLPSGMSEPMLMAFACWALDRHLAGRPRAAYVLLCGAGLLRPEVWPFLLGYAIWLQRRRLAGAVFRLGLGLLVLAGWLLPEWWGSGNPLRQGMGRATAGGPVTTDHPGLAVLGGTFDGLLGIVWVGTLIGIAFAVARRDRLLLAITGLGAGWLAIIAVLAELGKSSGVTRYLIVTQAFACVLAGVGWVQAVGWLRTRLAGRVPRPAAFALPLLLAGVLAVPSALALGSTTRSGWDLMRYQQGAYLATSRAVEQAGGAQRLTSCASPYVWSAILREPEFVWLLDTELVYGRSEWTPDLDRSAELGPMVRVTLQGSTEMAPQPFPGVAYTVAGRATANGVTAEVLTTC